MQKWTYALECSLQTIHSSGLWLWLPMVMIFTQVIKPCALKIPCRMVFFQTERSHVRLDINNTESASNPSASVYWVLSVYGPHVVYGTWNPANVTAAHQTCVFPPYHREGFVSRPKELLWRRQTNRKCALWGDISEDLWGLPGTCRGHFRLASLLPRLQEVISLWVPLVWGFPFWDTKWKVPVHWFHLTFL